MAANEGFNPASDSTVVPGRGNSSTASASDPSAWWIAITLRSKAPSASAFAARSWLSAAKASTSALLKCSSVAIRSAEIPCGTVG